MDLVLHFADDYILDDLYRKLPTYLPRETLLRQAISLWSISFFGVIVLYLSLSSLSYHFFFDKQLMKHPKFLKNQIRREITLSMTSFPTTALVTIPWFIAEVRGYSKLYTDVSEYGWTYFFASIAMFVMFTDFGVYWIHRLEHHPMLYSWLHKGHHAWKVSTPFASFAFHPLDGYFQSLPMHIFVFLVPMNSYAYLTAFVLIQIWTVSIHDGVYIVSNAYLNSSAHHTTHHLEFNYNFGQYFTLWDRIGGSYKRPSFELENNMFFDKLAKGKHAIFQESMKSK